MSGTVILRNPKKYKDAVACAECIESAVTASLNSGTLLDVHLVSSFYDQLVLCLHTLVSHDQQPLHITRSISTLISQCTRQQRMLSRLTARAHTDKITAACNRDEGGSHADNVDTSGSDDTVFTSTNSQLTFDDVAGLDDVKRVLYEAAILPAKFPHIFSNDRRAWRRVLLHGPPGTGKSRVAEALAGEISAPLITVTADHVLSAYVGQTEKRLTAVFERANRAAGTATAVLLFDELDGVCRRRDGGEHEHTRRLKTHLLQLIDRVVAPHCSRTRTHDGGAGGGKCYGHVLLLAATNCPWDLDAAFMRRFQRRVYVPLPDRQARANIVRLHLGGLWQADASEDQWNRLLANTSGFSGSDLAHMVQHALYRPVHHMLTATHWRAADDGQFMACSETHTGAFTATLDQFEPHKVLPRNVQMEDLLEAASTVCASVSTQMIDQYTRFNSE